VALDCGISPFLFWDLSISEVSDIVESYNRKKRQEMKQDLLFQQVLSIQIRQEIMPFLVEKIPDDYKPKQLWDFFPELFEEEKKAYQSHREVEDLESLKEKRRLYASRVNKKMKEGGFCDIR